MQAGEMPIDRLGLSPITKCKVLILIACRLCSNAQEAKAKGGREKQTTP